jgi:hypothetical protein
VQGAHEGVAVFGQLVAQTEETLKAVLQNTRRFSPVANYITMGLTSYGWFGGSAGSMKERAGYAVAVESGSSLQILFALLRLAREPSTFAAFKSVQQPPIEKAFGLPVVTKNMSFAAVGNANTSSPTLRPDRKLYGCIRLLHSHALTYLFLHEIAHVLQGHIEFCWRAKHKALQIPRVEREEFLCNELRPLEFLADRGALNIGILLILGGIASDTQIQNRLDAAREHLTLWEIAVGVVSLLYEHFSSEGDPHPPATHRTLFIQAAVHAQFSGFQLAPAEMQKAINAGIEEVTRGWDALGWPRDRRVPNDVDAFLAPIWDVDSRCERPKGPPSKLKPPVTTRRTTAGGKRRGASNRSA